MYDMITRMLGGKGGDKVCETPSQPKVTISTSVSTPEIRQLKPCIVGRYIRHR